MTQKASDETKKAAEKEFEITNQKDLKFCGDILIEIRFHQLCYTLIHALQTDDLVSHDYDVNHSIRVVLGSLEDFKKELTA